MKTKPYLVVYDIEGEISLAKVEFTESQVKAAQNLTSVYFVMPLPLENLTTEEASVILELRTEFDDDIDEEDDFDGDDDTDNDKDRGWI